MEFWGIEIKPGKPLKVEPDFGYAIHVSQIALGELKMVKEDEKIPVYVTNGEEKSKFSMGTLSQKFPQASIDLFFKKEFELSHNSESSVYILGYQTPFGPEDDEENDSDSDELEEYMEQLPQRNEPMGQKCGFIRSALKRKPEENESDSDEDESDSDEMGSEEDSDDEEVEDKAPLKVESPSKKGPNDEAVKNTVASKKECPNKAFIAAGGKKLCRC